MMRLLRWHGLRPTFLLASKDLKVALSYRVSFVTSHLAVFQTLIIFYFVTRVIGQTDAVGSSEDYFRFIVIGMVLGSSVDTSVSAAVNAARRDQVEGTLEAVASLPISASALGLSWIAFPVVDALIGSVVIVLLALPLGLVGADPNWLTVAVIILLCVAIFTSLGLLGAALVIAFQQGAGIISMALAILSLISGMLFPVSVMPQWLQTVSLFSPVRHGLDALRPAALESATLADVSSQVGVLFAFLAVLGPLGVLGLEASMRYARRTGGLSRF